MNRTINGRSIFVAGVLLLGAGVVPGVAGCSGTQRTSECAAGDRTAGERTAGVSLELLVQADANSFARYAVEEDGTIAFGGGINAQVGTYDWRGQMTDEELVELDAILTAHDYFRRRPSSPDRPMDTVEYTLDISAPNGSRRHSVTGRSDDLEPLHQLLRRAALRRHQGVLDRMRGADT